MVEDILQRSVGPCRQALKDAGSRPTKIDEVVLVGGQTRMPPIQAIVKEIFGKEPHKGVNPDEVVAVGAAVQGGVLAGDVKDMLLLDVTPLSLGVETLGGVLTRLIERNTTIPTKKSEVFSTAIRQPDVGRDQGAAGRARDGGGQQDCSASSSWSASRRRRAACRRSRSTFDIDANGIVNVAAKDRGTGKEQKITITVASGLDKNEIEKAVKDADSHRAEDKQRREAVEARNQLDWLVYSTEKSSRRAARRCRRRTKASSRAPRSPRRRRRSRRRSATPRRWEAAQDRRRRAQDRRGDVQDGAAPAPQGRGSAAVVRGPVRRRTYGDERRSDRRRSRRGEEVGLP